MPAHWKMNVRSWSGVGREVRLNCSCVLPTSSSKAMTHQYRRTMRRCVMPVGLIQMVRAPDRRSRGYCDPCGTPSESLTTNRFSHVTATQGPGPPARKNAPSSFSVRGIRHGVSDEWIAKTLDVVTNGSSGSRFPDTRSWSSHRVILRVVGRRRCLGKSTLFRLVFLVCILRARLPPRSPALAFPPQRAVR